MQKALEAELQGLVSQASSLETQLAAEPAKQRALALQVQREWKAKLGSVTCQPITDCFPYHCCSLCFFCIMHLDVLFVCLVCCT